MVPAPNRTGREQLIERAAQHSGFVAVETGGGFDGDGFVASLLRWFADREIAAVDLEDPDAVDENAALGLAVIRAPLVSGLRGWRDTVAARAGAGRPTVVVLPPGVSADALLREQIPAFVIDTAALTLQAADVAELIVAVADNTDPLTGHELRSQAAGLGEVVNRLGDGWPAWAQACVAGFVQSASGVVAVSTFGTPAFRSTVISRHLAPFAPRDVVAMAQLAHFPTFSASAAAAVAGLDFAEAVLLHAPGLTRTPSGLYRFVEPVRSHLIAQHPLQAEAAEIVAPTLIGEGEVIAAANALISAGLATQACELVDAVPGSVLDRANQRELLAVLRVLSAHAPHLAGLPLKIARAHGNLAEVLQSIQECERVLAIAEPSSSLWLEAATERMWHRHMNRSIEHVEAEAEIKELRATLGALGSSAQPSAHVAAAATRLREIEAGILGQSPDVRIVQRAADLFAEAAAEWEHQGEKLRAARTLRGAAAGPLHHLGHYRHAQMCLERAARLAIEQTLEFGKTLGQKARYDAMCADRAAFDESYNQARFIIEGSGIDWLHGHLLWCKAIDAAWDSDAMEIDRCFRACRELLGPQYQANAVILHADIAESFARSGHHERAAALLDAVRGDQARNTVEFAMADIVVAARSGDHSRAEAAWSALDATGLLPNDRRWRALAEIQASRPVPDPNVVEVIRRDTDRLRLSHLLPLLTPALVDEQPSAEGRTVGRGSGREVLLFGAVGVRGAGDVVTQLGASTKAAQLLGLLATSGGVATVDAISDVLWPGEDLKVGARRLKNVVKRLRDEFGSDIVIRADGHVRFGDVQTDVARFAELVQRVKANRRTSPQQARSDAIAALEVHVAPFLDGQDDRLEVQTRRRELQNIAEEMLDYLVSDHGPSTAWVAATRDRLRGGALGHSAKG